MKTFARKLRDTFAAHIKEIFVIALLAVALEFVFAWFAPQPKQYTLEGVVGKVFPQENVIYGSSVYENGWYTVIGADPGMQMDTSAHEKISTVLLTLSQPIKEPLAFQLFYHNGSDGYPYSEACSVVSYMMPGETQVAVTIPYNHYPFLRFDIDINVPLQSITCTAGGYTEQETVRKGIEILPLHMLLLFVLFVVCYASVKNKSFCGWRRIGLKQLFIIGVVFACAAIVAVAAYYILYEFGFPASQPMKVFCVIASLTAAFCFLLRKTIASKPENCFALIAVVVGCMFVWGMDSAPVNSWDELYHFKNALDAGNLLKYPNLFSLEDLWAIPSGILMQIARLFRTDAETMMRMSKMGNLLAYTAVGYFAIRKLKSGKMILTVLLLAPTNLLMASSFSYDPFTTVWTALAFAFFFEEWTRPNEPIKWRNVLFMVGAFAMGVQAKQIYIVMLPIFLCLPDSKFVSKAEKRRYWLLVCSVTMMVLLSFVAPFLLDMGSKTDVRGGGGVSAGNQVKYILIHPVAYTKTLIDFLLSYLAPANSDGYVTSLVCEGSAPNLVLYMMMLSVVAFTDWNGNSGLSDKPWWMKGYCLFMLFATVCIFSTCFYITFTPVGHHTINGCQPRYLIPVLFPAIYLLGEGKVSLKMHRGQYHAVVLVLAAYVAFEAVLRNIIL